MNIHDLRVFWSLSFGLNNYNKEFTRLLRVHTLKLHPLLFKTFGSLWFAFFWSSFEKDSYTVQLSESCEIVRLNDIFDCDRLKKCHNRNSCLTPYTNVYRKQIIITRIPGHKNTNRKKRKSTDKFKTKNKSRPKLLK